MSETNAPKLYMPSTIEEEENAVLERFIEASREIAPSMQVTLAKRFVQPGSNRVLCLAAKTTVPLNENELASVSDLAIRLSDGTNVVLSLSMFDESTGASYYQQPFQQQQRPVYQQNPFPRPAYANPYPQHAYEPYRYEVHVTEKSKLGPFFVLTTLFMTGAFYLCVNWTPAMTANLEDILRHTPLSGLMKSPVGANLYPASAPNVTLVKATTFPVPAKNFGKPNALPSSRTTAKVSANAKSQPASIKASHARSTNVRQKISGMPRSADHVRGKGSIFVPPPPPTIYTLPAGPPPAMAQFWGFAPAPTNPKPPVKAKPESTGTARSVKSVPSNSESQEMQAPATVNREAVSKPATAKPAATNSGAAPETTDSDYVQQEQVSTGEPQYNGPSAPLPGTSPPALSDF